MDFSCGDPLFPLRNMMEKLLLTGPKIQCVSHLKLFVLRKYLIFFMNLYLQIFLKVVNEILEKWVGWMKSSATF